MTIYGYCDSCGLLINGDHQDAHEEAAHGGEEVSLLLYKPDFEQISRRVETLPFDV